MLKRLYPKEYVDSIFHIDFDGLFAKGIGGLIFDIDNTLVPFDIKSPTPEIMELFQCLQSKGFKICLVSNNNQTRVTGFNEALNLPAVHSAKKPMLKGINRALSLIGTDAGHAAFIGDQVFTDVWCGNRKGIYTILVKPASERDELSVRIKRGIEKMVIRQYLKKQP